MQDAVGWRLSPWQRGSGAIVIGEKNNSGNKHRDGFVYGSNEGEKKNRKDKCLTVWFLFFWALIEGSALRGPRLRSLNNTDADYEVIIKHKSECDNNNLLTRLFLYLGAYEMGVEEMLIGMAGCTPPASEPLGSPPPPPPPPPLRTAWPPHGLGWAHVPRTNLNPEEVLLSREVQKSL